MILTPFIAFGIAHASSPPPGTWWEPGQPATFSQLNAIESIGVKSEHWAVEAAWLGQDLSKAVACADAEPRCTRGKLAMSHWYGREAPFGVWATWEPSRGRWFAQIGPGVIWPNFRMTIPDWYGRKLVVRNVHEYPSWIAGAGVHLGKADLMFNVRSTQPYWCSDGGDAYLALSRYVYVVQMRVSF